MFTLIFVLVIVLTIIVAYMKHKQEQVVGLSLHEILQKHRSAYSSYRGWLIFSIIILIIGFLLSEFCDMYETEEYEYWLFGTQKGTREVLTAEAWWSYILRFFGVLIGIPCLIGFLDRRNAIKRYEAMSINEYSTFQQQIRQEIKKQEENTKKAKRVNTAIKIFGKLLNG